MKAFCCWLTLCAMSWGQAQRPPLPEGIQAKRDVTYVSGGTERQRLDVYYPEKTDKPVPLVVWIHGGAWLGGSKDRCPALPLLREGYAVASVTYRFSQNGKLPAQIEDCKAAIRWLRAHAKDLNIDPAHIGVWGSSAGGHLVALLGVASDEKKWEKGEHLDQPSKVQAVVNWFGPSNLLTMGEQSGPDSRIRHDAADSPESKLIGGAVQENKEAANAASPVTYVTKDDAPMLLMHGDRDNVVPHGQSVELHAALEKAGVKSELRTIKGAGHGGPGFNDPESLKAVWDFFAKYLRS